MHVLVTGGLGYIGVPSCIALIQHGHQVTILDNLHHSSLEALAYIEQQTGLCVAFIQADIRDTEALSQLFKHTQIDAVLHLAGLKSILESMQYPTWYEDVNHLAVQDLVHVMQCFGVAKLVFSSSATIYESAVHSALCEKSKIDPHSPYGVSKYQAECYLQQYGLKYPELQVSILRYFNPIGGWVNPQLQGCQVLDYLRLAHVSQQTFQVYGTGIRDYVHVLDVAQANVLALTQLQGIQILNIASGQATSVLDLIRQYEVVHQCRIAVEMQPPREGEQQGGYACIAQAYQVLKWQPQYSLSQALN